MTKDYKERIRELHKDVYLVSSSQRLRDLMRHFIEQKFPECFAEKEAKR